MNQFDDRIVKIVFTIGTQQSTIDTSTADPKRPPLIVASGTKYVDATQNECTLLIGGLSRELRNALATNLTPMNYNAERKSVEVWAGRVSTGMFLRYSGDIITAVPSQPPNITMLIRSKTAYWYKQDVLAQSYAVAQVPMSQIAGDVAKSMGLNLNFQAADRNIQNYAYNGSVAKQVDKLNALGGMDAYIDDGSLVCKNRGEALKNVTHVLSAQSGMIGQVELTEYGIRTKSLLSPSVQLGATLTLDSVQNPSLNGDYTIYRTSFDISTRDLSFYDVIESTRYPQMFWTATLPT
jgi:hypothetical protein